MDPVTHTLVGVNIANGFFRERLGKKAVPILILASSLPDIDVLAHLVPITANIAWRRTVGHSVLLLPVWCAAFTYAVRRWLYHGLARRTVFFIAALACAAHLLFDFINSFGLVPLWPLSFWRPEAGAVFILDLGLTGILAIPLIAYVPRWVKYLPTVSRWALAMAAAYLMAAGSLRASALVRLSEEAVKLGVRPDFVYVFPEPLGPHRWRGVIRASGIYRVYLVEPLKDDANPKFEYETADDDPRVLAVRETAAGKRLDWFFKAPVWTVRPGPAGEPSEVSVFDLRFTSLVVRRDRPFLYRFKVYPDGRVEDLR